MTKATKTKTKPPPEDRPPSKLASRGKYSVVGHNGTQWTRVATAESAAEAARSFLAALPAYLRLQVYDPDRVQLMMSETSAARLAPPDALPDAPSPAPELAPEPGPPAPVAVAAPEPAVPVVPPAPLVAPVAGTALPRPRLTLQLTCKISAEQRADLEAIRSDAKLWPGGFAVDIADVVRAALDDYRETWRRGRTGQQLAIPGTGP